MKRYTLQEAREELARGTCEREGHDYELIVNASFNWPARVVCLRCGRSSSVGTPSATRLDTIVERS